MIENKFYVFITTPHTQRGASCVIKLIFLV